MAREPTPAPENSSYRAGNYINVLLNPALKPNRHYIPNTKFAGTLRHFVLINTYTGTKVYKVLMLQDNRIILYPLTQYLFHDFD